MAYSIRFVGYSKSNGSELLNIEPRWWTVDELKKTVQFKWVVSNNTGSYRDEDADISIADARALHAHFAADALEKIAYNLECISATKLASDEYAAIRLADYVAYAVRLKADFDSIESAVGTGSDQFSHFHVCVFEWDSGL